MKELIIKVDDPGERVWDGSPKTFEIQELVRCGDCKNLDYTNSHWFCKWLNRCVDEEWFCADGERRSE